MDGNVDAAKVTIPAETEATKVGKAAAGDSAATANAAPTGSVKDTPKADDQRANGVEAVKEGMGTGGGDNAAEAEGAKNKGLRYWTCANYQPRPFKRPRHARKGARPAAGDGDEAEEKKGARCNFFRWLDTPRVTKEEKAAAAREKRRKRELALLA
ncbi:unnamed protein product [Closterium sp. Naga37s-1]|nr:unnamed protein product [Closterium sp. Naga37s-1]